MPITSATRFATRLKSFQKELFQAAFQLQEKVKEASSRKCLMKVLKISFLSPVVTLFFPFSFFWSVRFKADIPILGTYLRSHAGYSQKNNQCLSKVLSGNGKRTLTLRMIRSLHSGLGIPADILIQDASAFPPVTDSPSMESVSTQ